MSDEKAAKAEREKKLRECQKAIGHRFTDRTLLELALTHSSLKDPWTESNERLEFLGDSVIGLAVSEHLFCTHADYPEGELTRIKSIVVSKSALARVGRTLDIRQFLRVGKGIRKRRSIPPSLIANTVEALVGAVYLDAGFEVARAMVLSHLQELLGKVTKRRDVRNYKAALQQSVQRQFGTTPQYRVLETVGPDHKKEFVIEALVAKRAFPSAKGSTKKQAEQRAAKEALRALKQEHGSQPA
ncbi:MAG: ribonuclease III [Planctomycetota bacterium]